MLRKLVCPEMFIRSALVNPELVHELKEIVPSKCLNECVDTRTRVWGDA